MTLVSIASISTPRLREDGLVDVRFGEGSIDRAEATEDILELRGG